MEESLLQQQQADFTLIFNKRLACG